MTILLRTGALAICVAANSVSAAGLAPSEEPLVNIGHTRTEPIVPTQYLVPGILVALIALGANSGSTSNSTGSQ